MNRLKPYSLEKAKFLLEADANVSDSILIFEYRLSDEAGLFKLPETTQSWNSPQIPKAEGLWNRTCFEAFLSPYEMDMYYEFNFSLDPAWNIYHFDRYRDPQPARATDDFKLKTMTWNHLDNCLKVELTNNTKFKRFKVGLTAVLEEKNGRKHYCALTHAGPKPDFHLSESFTLIRG